MVSWSLITSWAPASRPGNVWKELREMPTYGPMRNKGCLGMGLVMQVSTCRVLVMRSLGQVKSEKVMDWRSPLACQRKRMPVWLNVESYQHSR